MKASILTVGDEILIGKIVNTNASYISRKINEMGIMCPYQITCADDESEIVSSLDILKNKSDLIIVTGGLGVTDDDITKRVIAKYCDLPLVESEQAKADVEKYYTEKGLSIQGKLNDFIKFPKNAQYLKNETGVAAGFIVSAGKKKIIVFPGPPTELIPMFEKQFLPILSDIVENKLITKFFKIFGMRELEVVSMVSDLIELKDEGIFLTTYADNKEISLVLRHDEDVNEELLQKVVMDITERFGKNLFSFTNNTLEEVLYSLLAMKKTRFAVAESISGGMLSSKIVSVPGMSEYFLEGIVSYSNEAKISRLGVSSQTIQTLSAVSEKTAYEMCEGLFNSNPLTEIALATTGFAGPTSENDNSEIGKCFISIGTKGKIKVFKHKFSGSRELIRDAVTKQALFYLINLLRYNEI